MGARGRDWVREIRKNEQYALVACVDADRKVLELSTQAEAVSPKQCFTDLKQALDKNSVDAVIVATSPDSHVSVCETALSEGKGVLVEKPFTLSLKEAVSLVSLADSRNTPLMVAQNYRYMRSFRTAHKLINECALGPVGIVVLQYYRVPHDVAPSLARLRHSVLWGMGVHHLDALRFILQKKVTGVLAQSFTLPWGVLPPGASLQVMLELEEGTRAFYSASYESSGHEFFEHGQEFYARFVGARATLHVLQRWLVLCEKGKMPRLIRRGARRTTEEQVLLEDLQKALTSGEQPDSSGRDNLQTMAVAEACIRAAAEKRWINPQELLNELE
jgi:predicted dehydrogenase